MDTDALYRLARSFHDFGGPIHIVWDDMNTDDGSIAFCRANEGSWYAEWHSDCESPNETLCRAVMSALLEVIANVPTSDEREEWIERQERREVQRLLLAEDRRPSKQVWPYGDWIDMNPWVLITETGDIHVLGNEREAIDMAADLGIVHTVRPAPKHIRVDG